MRAATCWQVLGIEPTNDLEVVKRAYRSLMKRWHPDTVDNDRKDEYTDRCATINAAYDEAVRIASSWSSTPPRADEQPFGYRPPRVYRFQYELGAGSWFWFAVGFVLLYFFSVIGFVMFVAGAVAAACVDGLVYVIALKRFRPQFGRMIWLILIVLNSAIAGFNIYSPFNLGMMLVLPLWLFKRRIAK